MLDVKKILNELAVKEDMVAAEFGCGAGTFSIELAKKLKTGKIGQCLVNCL